MVCDLQKASMWKRISAYILDVVLLGTLAVGIAYLLCVLLGYDGYNAQLSDAYARYEAEYGITFDITEEAYNSLPEEKQADYDAAYQALIADEDALYAYNMVINLTLMVTTVCILLAYLLLEFMVPLLFGNGQTLGKKVFSIGLMRTDCVRLTALQLFIRTVLGKFTIETMIPVYILIMLFFNSIGLLGTALLAGLLLAQLILLAVSKNNYLIHDVLAGTVAVDISSQRIFRDPQDLIEYTKRIHAERAVKQDY